MRLHLLALIALLECRQASEAIFFCLKLQNLFIRIAFQSSNYMKMYARVL